MCGNEGFGANGAPRSFGKHVVPYLLIPTFPTKTTPLLSPASSGDALSLLGNDIRVDFVDTSFQLQIDEDSICDIINSSSLSDSSDIHTCIRCEKEMIGEDFCCEECAEEMQREDMDAYFTCKHCNDPCTHLVHEKFCSNTCAEMHYTNDSSETHSDIYFEEELERRTCCVCNASFPSEECDDYCCSGDCYRTLYTRERECDRYEDDHYNNYDNFSDDEEDEYDRKYADKYD